MGGLMRVGGWQLELEAHIRAGQRRRPVLWG